MLNYFKKLLSKLKPKEKPEYAVTAFVLLRVLAIVYLFAFLSLATQLKPLIGENGLLPAKNFLGAVESQSDSKTNAFTKLPTIFWFNASDEFMIFLAWLGVILSLVVLFGFANAPLMLVLWAIYFSFVHVGQLWYSYGWEIQLLETGFLAIFLCPLLDLRPFARKPSPIVIWLFRWLAFRIYLGAGLIKIRGDSCWRDLTCLYYHYETQPIPNPLSGFFHFLPKWLHKFGVLWNYFVELIVPFFVFSPRVLRNIAGILMISFQFILILSGNLSFLNWITIVPCIACFDDKFFRKMMPKWLLNKSDSIVDNRMTKIRFWASAALLIIIIWLSIPVVKNILSPYQIMNTSFNQLHLVNTYGAFGAVGKIRGELIIEGTDDKVLTAETKWKEYEFKGKPGNIYKIPPIIAPYQPRIDWQIWFAAMQRPEQNPWLIHFIWKLLRNDKDALSLLNNNPFPINPPKYIRIEYYQYKFANLGDKSGAVWERKNIGTWLPPLNVENGGLRKYIEAYGWKVE